MEQKEVQKPLQENPSIKACKARWVVLTIFILYNAISVYQWIEYSIITNVMVRYYNVAPIAIEWTSIIFMAFYAPLVIPASYILDKKGLRFAALLGCLGTAVGTSVKIFSTGRHHFWVVLLGQSILAVSQLFIIFLPPHIAAIWFKANEVSTACSLGVFGSQLGCALGFFLTPLIVRDQDVETVGHDLKILCWGLSVAMIPAVLAVIFYFPARPKHPPNVSQLEERRRSESFSNAAFFQSIKNLLVNGPFMVHVIAYGINIGVFSAIGPLLNQIVLQYFPNSQEFVGQMGLVMIVIGMVGSVVFGVFLDKTHRFKETTIFTYLMSLLAIIGFMYALERKSKYLVYSAAAAMGFFTNAYVPVGFEFAMELTFPASEGTTTGLLMAPSQIFGVLFALILGHLNTWIGPFWALGSQAGLLIIGTILTSFVPNKLKRQEVFRRRRDQVSEIENGEEMKVN